MPSRGQVWLVDLGMAGKTRPALILNKPFGDADRALVTIIPHTLSLRGSQFEIAVPVPFLRGGAFLVQNPVTIPAAKDERFLGGCSRLVEPLTARPRRWPRDDCKSRRWLPLPRPKKHIARLRQRQCHHIGRPGE